MLVTQDPTQTSERSTDLLEFRSELLSKDAQSFGADQHDACAIDPPLMPVPARPA